MAENLKELEQIFQQKQRYIDRQQLALLKGASSLELILLKAILDELYNEFVLNRGVITSGTSTVSLVVAIDKIFDAFLDKQTLKVAQQITKDFDSILEYDEGYYSLFETNRRKYTAVRNRVRSVMLKKIGINKDGDVRPNGYIDSLIKNARLRDEIKQMVYGAVNRQQKLSDFTESLRLKITGAKGVDGSLVKYYKGFAYDTYAQFDRASNKEFAAELELKFFMYSGGLIETSRAFCIEKEGIIFSEKEAMLKWPNDPNLPRTVDEQNSGVLIGYNPIVDMGRWRCRHLPRYISKEIAVKLDPKAVTGAPLKKRTEITADDWLS